MKLLSALIAVCSAVALAGAVTPAHAAEGGKAATAAVCQQGGWRQWSRANQAPFENAGECVEYVARGGTLTPKPAAQVLCESLSGTYAPGSGTVFWLCTYSPTNPNESFQALANQCVQDVLAVYPKAWVLVSASHDSGLGLTTLDCSFIVL